MISPPPIGRYTRRVRVYGAANSVSDAVPFAVPPERLNFPSAGAEYAPLAGGLMTTRNPSCAFAESTFAILRPTTVLLHSTVRSKLLATILSTVAVTLGRPI